MDATGGGLSFCDIVDEVWSPRYLRIQFGGSASDLPVSYNDPRTGAEAYCNRVTELWFSGLVFLGSKQIVGMDDETAKELCARRYTVVKGENVRTLVEAKRDMSKRIGFSPDRADAAMILLDLARHRFNFFAHGMEGARRTAGSDWEKFTDATNNLQPSYAPDEEEIQPREGVW